MAARKVTRKTAISKLKRIEGGLLNAKMMIDGYIGDVQAVIAWLEGPDKEEKKS